jgi:hypothetical protein
MTGSAQVDYSPGFFLPQAHAWVEQANVMGLAAAESSGLRINGGGSWPFAGAVAAYNQLCVMFNTLSTQGQQQMIAICDALCTAAKQYGATEDQLIQASDGVFR